MSATFDWLDGMSRGAAERALRQGLRDIERHLEAVRGWGARGRLMELMDEYRAELARRCGSEPA